MPRISQLSTEAPASTSDLVLNVGSTTRRANVQQILSVPVTAQGDMLFGDSSADSTRLAPPTSGAILAYSSASSAPSWSIPTSGAVLVASSVGTPVWRAIGTSGQILESTGGTPTWVTQAGVGTTEVWVLTKDTSQAFASTGTWTTVNWKVDEIDTDNFHSTATSAAEVNIRVAGTYLMGVIVNLEPNATGSRQLRILEGSTMIIRTEQDPSTIGASGLQAHVVRNFGTSGITLTVEVLTEGSTAAITAGSGLDAKWWGHRISA